MPDTLTWSPTTALPEPAPIDPRVPEPNVHDALPPATRLDEFEIVRVLGAGGFGIVYLALDHVLLRYVAIKEYMPASLAGRGPGAAVSVRAPSNADTYAIGLESFFNEARMLANFDHPSLVKVHRFWKANGTAYMAMQYYPGRTLREVRGEMRTTPEESWLRACIEPLLGALEVLHAEDIFHRDIAPDNILLLPDGRPVLLDFGSARRVIGDRTQSLTAILKPNFAPIEQYGDEPGMRQGPWTDLYALGATMHFMLTGLVPVPAVLRAVRDTMRAVSDPASGSFPGVNAPVLATIDWALALAPEDRPQSVDTLRRGLRGECEVPKPSPRQPAVPRAVAETPPPVTVAVPELDLSLDSMPAPLPQPQPAPLATPMPRPSKARTAVPQPQPAPPAAPRKHRGLAIACAGAVVAIVAGFGASRLGSTPVAVTASAAASAPAPVAAASAPTQVAVTPPPPVPVVEATPPVAEPAPVASAPQAAAPVLATAAPAAPGRRAAARLAAEAKLARLPPKQAQVSEPVQAQVPPPQPVAIAPVAKSPAELCGDMNSVALAMCVAWKCRSPALQADPQCVESRRNEEQRQRRMEQR